MIVRPNRRATLRVGRPTPAGVRVVRLRNGATRLPPKMCELRLVSVRTPCDPAGVCARLMCGGKIDDGRATPFGGVAFECRKHGAYVVARTAPPRFIQLDATSQEAAVECAALFKTTRNGEVIVTALDF